MIKNKMILSHVTRYKILIRQFQMSFSINAFYLSSFYTKNIEEEPYLNKTHIKKNNNHKVDFGLSCKSPFDIASNK